MRNQAHMSVEACDKQSKTPPPIKRRSCRAARAARQRKIRLHPQRLCRAERKQSAECSIGLPRKRSPRTLRQEPCLSSLPPGFHVGYPFADLLQLTTAPFFLRSVHPVESLKQGTAVRMLRFLF